MIEVFRTNVNDYRNAEIILDQIHQAYSHYRANFDLSDCDEILRVQSTSGGVVPSLIIDLLKIYGVEAEVLPDAVPSRLPLSTVNEKVKFFVSHSLQ